MIDVITAIPGMIIVVLLCGVGFAIADSLKMLESPQEPSTVQEEGAAFDTDAVQSLKPVWYRNKNIILSICVSAVVWLIHALLSDDVGSIARIITDVVLIAAMTLLMWIDIRRKIVPNKILAVVLALWLLVVGVYIILEPEGGLELALRGLAGAVISGSVFLLCYLITRRQIGGGDVKLAFIMGLYLTGERIIGAIFYGALLSSLFAILLVCLKKICWKDSIPLVPFLYIGTLIIFILS